MPKLTDAEWQIMRVLWESKAASASQIASALMDSKAWKITTVKTFLSRLVEKQWIRFEEQGKKFVYLPLWSERECVFQEMKQVLQRIYGGKVLLQTPRFEFYGVDYPELIKRLSAHLEAQADRIELRYQIKYAERQQVYLYGSTYRLHSALGRLSAPEWLRAGLEWDIIHLAPEAAFDDLSIEAAATQVWMQRILYSINPNAPYWLTQGIRTFESQIISEQRMNQAMKLELPSLNKQSIKRLSSQYDLFKINHGYELTQTVIEYMASNYGWDAIVNFVKNPEDYETVFGCDESAFWEGWLKSVQMRFARKEGVL